MQHVTIEEHDVPGDGPYALTTGQDGGLWTALETGALARISRTP